MNEGLPGRNLSVVFESCLPFRSYRVWAEYKISRIVHWFHRIAVPLALPRSMLAQGRASEHQVARPLNEQAEKADPEQARPGRTLRSLNLFSPARKTHQVRGFQPPCFENRA